MSTEQLEVVGVPTEVGQRLKDIYAKKGVCGMLMSYLMRAESPVRYTRTLSGTTVRPRRRTGWRRLRR